MRAPGADLPFACDAQALEDALKMLERIARLKIDARHAAVGIKRRVSLYPVLLTLSIATRLGAEEGLAACGQMLPVYFGRKALTA
jgi:hypothetical protein